MTFEEWAEAVPGPWLRIGADRGWIRIPEESGPSIGLSPEEAEQHQPRRLVEQVGPAIWCTCGVSLWAPTEQALARMWREHLIHAVGLIVEEA